MFLFLRRQNKILRASDMQNKVILIGHGSGGRLSRQLISQLFVKYFSNESLNRLGDASWFELAGGQLAFTTDSYVIDPIFFPGGDIGRLAVCGTVNDLSVAGADPRYLSAGFIIEEGFPLADLEKIVRSMAVEAAGAGVKIVTGDTKVVKKGQCDKIFINTSGIGLVPEDRYHLKDGACIEPGDKIVVSGTLGDHAIAILSARENLRLDEAILSDAAPLNHLTSKILKTASSIRFMRDITRGGLASVLAEVCEGKPFGMHLEENSIPVRRSVLSICELYGFDPLHLANEGKIMIIVKQGEEDQILKILRQDPLGSEACIIGEITGKNEGKVLMTSSIGGTRIIDMLNGEMLPRIC
jgi:hydrogenase expression/formation protein HypE